MSFREEFDNACHQLNTYRHPDIGDFKQKLSDILEAADLPGIMHDQLDSIDEYGDMITINSSWSVRSCDCSGSSDLPSFIIDAEDPIKAATIWGIEKNLAAATERFNVAVRDMERNKQQIDELTLKLGELK